MTKTLLVSMTLVLTASAAWADIALPPRTKTQYGSACGLIDSADNLELNRAKVQKLTLNTRMSKLVGNQILVTAQEGIDAYIDQRPLDNATEGIQALVRWSEGGDVYREVGSFQGRKLEIIRYYPGGNPAGLIFNRGSVKPIASIQDSDIVCAK